MPEDTPQPAAVATTVVTPEPSNLTFYAKCGATLMLGIAVLALDVMKVPADHFINLVAVPGLAYLGLHSAAKTLN